MNALSSEILIAAASPESARPFQAVIIFSSRNGLIRFSRSVKSFSFAPTISVSIADFSLPKYFLAFTVGVLSRVKAAFGVKHLAQQIVRRLFDHRFKKRFAGDRVRVRINTEKLGIVI